MRFPDGAFTHEIKCLRDLKMKNSSANAGKIYFLDFTFDPALRTLQRNDINLQLRKKQSGVLALLCAKYPNPVSQEDFLAEVWEGGYVTSQSIAQMIRSLRLSLGDESKSIIVTIPKLGYQLTAEPSWEEPEPYKSNFERFSSGTIELDNVSFTTQPVVSIKPPSSSTTMAVIPYSVPRTIPARRRFNSRTYIVSSVVAVFISLLYMALSVSSYPLNSSLESKDLFQESLVDIAPEITHSFLYCCITDRGVICSPRPNALIGKCIVSQKNNHG
ncbi:MAG TPA: winged helix-turn-helix domain-containing protein [Buttiauxella sp.]|jgi:putative transposase